MGQIPRSTEHICSCTNIISSSCSSCSSCSRRMFEFVVSVCSCSVSITSCELSWYAVVNCHYAGQLITHASSLKWVNHSLKPSLELQTRFVSSLSGWNSMNNTHHNFALWILPCIFVTALMMRSTAECECRRLLYLR